MQAFSSTDEINKRIKLLDQPHMTELNFFVQKLRTNHKDFFVPDFDPLDGGVNATALFLFEKPGAKTDRRSGGSGFISRDNDDRTAAATKEFLANAGINRTDTILWNLMPIWNGTRAVTPQERILGFGYLAELLSVLKKLSVVILVGKQAQRTKVHMDLSNYKVLESYHPSPLVKATAPDKWSEIGQIWKTVQDLV